MNQEKSAIDIHVLTSPDKFPSPTGQKVEALRLELDGIRPGHHIFSPQEAKGNCRGRKR